MKTNSTQLINQFSKSLWWLRAAGLAILIPSPSQADIAATNLTDNAEATVKETFDSNVYLQDNTPNAANVAAVPRMAMVRPLPLRAP